MADQTFDPDKFLTETASTQGSFDPDKFLADTAPTGQPNVGGLEAFGRGAAQAFGLGYSPQLIAAAKTMSMPGGDNPEYLKEVEKQKAANEQAWQQHPWIYGGGMAASAVPALANAIFAGPEELAAAGTIGGFGGLGLRTIAGEGAGLAPSALRGTATALENPVVQGAIMGSSEGDDLMSKTAGAAFGAAGAKVAPMILGAAAPVVKSVVSKIAPGAEDPIMLALTGGPTAAQQAGDLASKANTSLASGVVGGGPLQTLATKADFFAQVPKAAEKTLGEIGGQISDFVGTADRKSTGTAIRDAVQNWATDATKPTGFEAQMNSIYQPVRALEQSSAVVPIRGLQSEIIKQAQSNIAKLGNINPTLDLANSALTLNAQNGGLTFSEMQALKKILSDRITWNQAPGASAIDNNILKSLRAALDSDMQTYATKVGGTKIGQIYGQVKSQAKDLYDQRDSIFNITGNPIANAPGFKDSDTIFSNIIKSAAKKGGKDTENLANLQKAVSQYDPNAWASVGKAYAADMVPNDQFTYKNFNKLYDGYFRSHPTDPSLDGKTLIFGPKGSGGARDMMDAFHDLGAFNAKGVPLGQKLDNLASKAGQQPSTGTAILESAISGGIPWKSALAGAAGTAASSKGARNIAAPLPQYTPSKAAQGVAGAVQRTAPLIGAQALNPVDTERLKNQQRPGRKSGGRISDNLVAAADRAKKNINNNTESLLNVPDTHVAQALELANKYL